MFKFFTIVPTVLALFLVCSLASVNSAAIIGAQGSINDTADHIVNELRAKHFFTYKEIVPLNQLKDDSIVQMVNRKGYIRYFV